MRSAHWGSACLAAVLLIGVPSGADAQDPDVQALRQQVEALKSELDMVRKQYDDRLKELESRLSVPAPAVAAAPQAAAPEQAPVTAPVPAGVGGDAAATALPVFGRTTAGANVFNPDMAVIGDFLGAAGHNPVNPSPAFEMHESEVSLQAVVDPYARADFFISFGEEGVDLEEGFVTFPALPGGLLFRAGKMRAAFGKVNTLHNHVLTWTDRPLVTNNLVAGEEGISDAGLSVARLVPNPWIFLEATGQVFRGDSGDLFHSTSAGDLSYVGHLRGYHDLTENTNVDLGVSYARGHNTAGVVDDVDVGRFTTDLWGIDGTVRWRPLQRSIYHSFIARSELVWSNRQQFDATAKSFGYYVSGDYQLARRWFTGFRYDDSAHANDASARDRGQAVILTYWPSEFSQVRGQYRRIKYASADIANELLFQFQFSIGAHGAHPF